MVFTSRCWKSVFSRWVLVLALGLSTGLNTGLSTGLGFGFGNLAWANNESIDLQRAALGPSSDNTAWVISADFQLTLSPTVEDAVNKGLALYFVAEFELIQPRWYWRDNRLVTAELKYRLAYHALTRSYRLTANGFQSQYNTLQEALGVISRLRGWRVADRDRIKPSDKYEAWLRLRLDTTQLPKPFQMTAINNRDWNPESEWKRFPFPTETPKSAQ